MASADVSRLARLLQLASPALPVGAYSYSQALEAAVEAGVVKDAAGAERWIGDVLAFTVARLEAPVLVRLIDAWRTGDPAASRQWNDWFLASRETAELRAETVQMGYSLRRLLAELTGAEALAGFDEIAFPTAYAFAVAEWRIDARAALVAYLWAWCENQVMAALKAVPLGQTDGQRILLGLGDALEANADAALAMDDASIGTWAPGFAILSSQHETQYSRLFRS